MNIFNQINFIVMKMIFNKVMAAFIAISACFSVVSCEDENGGEIVDPNALKDINAVYSISVSEDYLYFYDITATYGYDEKDTIDKIMLDVWSKEQTYSTDDMETLPVRLFCTIKATPKSPVPAVDESKVYKFEYSNVCEIEGFTNDGRKIMTKNSPKNEKHSYPGSKMQDVLNKGEIKLVSFEYVRE